MATYQQLNPAILELNKTTITSHSENVTRERFFDYKHPFFKYLTKQSQGSRTVDKETQYQEQAFGSESGTNNDNNNNDLILNSGVAA